MVFFHSAGFGVGDPQIETAFQKASIAGQNIQLCGTDPVLSHPNSIGICGTKTQTRPRILISAGFL